jgi:LAO/AO transport system kinase
MSAEKFQRSRPEWAGDAHHGFASSVMSGVEGGHDGTPGMRLRARSKGQGRAPLALLPSALAEGVLAGERAPLARAITLIESNRADHRALATELLSLLQDAAGKSLRLGITGVPGAGKSTLIEALGLHLCEKGHKVAVLAVDPSSSRGGGSILGDKTRMEELSRHPGAFIRPSPSSGALGGVGRKSRETLMICEAAGFDVVLVETVGVGQSEVTVRGMVDMFVLVLIAGAGDELQGIKKGVIELADAILVNKADGDNLRKAQRARSEYETVLHYLAPATPGWKTPALAVSALTGEGIPNLWETVQEFAAAAREQGIFEERRRMQNTAWMHSLLEEGLIRLLREHPQIAEILPRMEKDVAKGELHAAQAVEKVLHMFRAALATPAPPVSAETEPL